MDDKMPIVELVRLEEAFQGTFGILRINKKVFCCTLERKDMENTVNISSIPAQQYLCRKTYSDKFNYTTFRVMNVPGRTGILFHHGNYEKDTEGCILLGRNIGENNHGRMVADSFNTFNRFMNHMKNEDTFHLSIFEVY